MKIKLKPAAEDMKRVLHLCLLCWFIWYSVTISGIWAYNNGWFGAIKPIDNFFNTCNKNYYFSTLIINNNEYWFDDVNGCTETKDTTCVYSIKEEGENKFYNKVHSIDPLTKNLLITIPRNSVIEPDIKDFSKYPAIDKLFNSTFTQLKKVFFLVYWQDNKIKKIFVITSSNPTKSCNKQAIKILNQMK